jgi:hypothetical protein
MRDNIRIAAFKDLLQGSFFRGYQARTETDNFKGTEDPSDGVTKDGQPVELLSDCSPGGFGDVDAWKYIASEHPKGAPYL